ncbi:MAG TPA: hypothetical protein VK327_19005 [Candidatus Paceibacterota bacterium]|nr:hypothetical protein [Candidatus Paceibacterota bacterium]
MDIELGGKQNNLAQNGQGNSGGEFFLAFDAAFAIHRDTQIRQL